MHIVFTIKKQYLSKKQEPSILLSNFGLKTPLSKFPLQGDSALWNSKQAFVSRRYVCVWN